MEKEGRKEKGWKIGRVKRKGEGKHEEGEGERERVGMLQINFSNISIALTSIWRGGGGVKEIGKRKGKGRKETKKNLEFEGHHASFVAFFYLLPHYYFLCLCLLPPFPSYQPFYIFSPGRSN